MKTSLLKYLTWISLPFLLLASCRSPQVLVHGESAARTWEYLSSGNFDRMEFKAKVIFRENELEGRLLIKNSGDGSSKVAFYNELGMTFLEGTLSVTKPGKARFTANNYADFLDYRVFLKSFGECLGAVYQPVRPALAETPDPGITGEDALQIKLKNGFRMKLKPGL